ncbi:MAG: DUF5801 repeats-in-toxin domain-containing protein [Devosia sp.]
MSARFLPVVQMYFELYQSVKSLLKGIMMTEQSNLDADTPATNVEGNSSDNLLVAQAETSAPPATLSSAPSGAEAGSQMVIELADGPILELPAGASIDQQRQVGVNLEFVQPDGSVIVVRNGAVQGLTIFIGDVEIPPLTVAALFEANGIQAAAGPSTPGAGHTWEQDVPGIGEADQAFGGLLGPSTGPQLTALLGRTPDAANLPPQFGGPSYTNVSEEGLREGNLDDAGAGDTTNAVFTTGDLGAIDPNGDPMTFTFGQPIAGLTSNGLPITWTGVGGQVLTGSTPDGLPAIIATVVNGTSGEYTVSLVQPLDHPVAGIEDSIDLVLSITADDGQGGTATTELTITIEDDSPLTVKADTAILDEDGLDTINAIGIGDTADGDAIGNDVSATGDLGILWGADRGDKGADITNPDGSFVQDDITAGGRAVYFTNADVGVLGALGGTLTSDGLPISFAVDASGTKLVGTVGGTRVVVEISLSDEGSGKFNVHLFDNLDHAVADTEDDINLTFSYTARDADGDTVDGSFTVLFDDDMPVVSNPTGSAPGVSGATLDEDDIVATLVQGAGTDGTQTASASGTLKVDFGADGFGSTAFSGAFSVPNAASGALVAGGLGVDSGMTSDARPILFRLSGDGQTIEAYTDAVGPLAEEIVFHADLDAGTAGWAVTLVGNIDHQPGDAGRGAGQSINFTVAATDGDGDTLQVTLSTRINDDSPVVSNPTGSAPGVSGATLDEDDIVATLVQGAGTDGTQTASASGTLKVDFGADGFGSTAFSGAFSVPNAASGALVAGGLGVDSGMTSDARPILFRLSGDGQTIEAYTDAVGPLAEEIVFHADLDAGTAGWAVTLVGNIDHQPGDAGRGAGQSINFTVAATDGDGDTLQVILSTRINDDSPVIGTPANARVDEDDLSTAAGRDLANGIGDTATGDINVKTDAALDADGDDTTVAGNLNINFGADGANGVVDGGTSSGAGDRAVTFAADAITTLQALSLTSQGDTVTYGLNGENDVLTATADGRVVFTVTLSDQGTGSYLFDLNDTLDHPLAGTEDNINLHFNFTATDADGDTASSSFRVRVDDDSPVIGSADASDITEVGTGLVVVNGSFDLNPLTTGQPGVYAHALGNYSYGSPSGWTIAGVGGLFAPIDSVSETDNHAGENVAWLSGGATLSQVNGQTLVAGEVYTLTLSVGDRSDLDWTGGEVRLVASNGGAPVILASQALPTPADGDWSHVTLQTGATDVAYAGYDLRIEVQQDAGGGGNQILVDDVQLAVFHPAVSTGSLDVAWGADGAGAHGAAFAAALAGVTALTSAGSAISYTLTNSSSLLTAMSADGRVIFIVELSAANQGAYTFTLLGNVDHTGAGNDLAQVLNFGFVATDGDGDHAEGTFNVTISDDVLVIGTAANARVDEDDLSTAAGRDLANGIGDTATGDINVKTDAALDADGDDTTVAGNLNINFGADGANGVVDGGTSSGAGDRAVTFAADAITTLQALSLTSQGDTVTYGLNGENDVLTATADGRVVFTVTLSDQGTGSYLFDLNDALDHPLAGTEDNLNLHFNFTATDADGDTASSSFRVRVDDDSPVISTPTDLNLDADVLVTLDASDNIASGSLGTDWGADSGNLTTGGAPGDRAANFSNGVTADNDVTVKSSGVPVDLTSNGETVSFGFIGGTLVGFTGADVNTNQVFTVALNDSTGSYDLTLLANLDYAGLSSAADNVIDLSFDFTVTDADGDTASGSFSVTVDDTAPVRVFDAAGDLVGTFGTIAEGLAATADGYTVRILPGTYAESDLAVDHAITIIGQGDVIVNAAGGDGFVVGDAGATETVRIENIAVNNAAGSGIVLNGSRLGTLEVVDASFGNNYRNGIEVSNGANLGAALIDNSDFTNNGGTRTGGPAQSSSGDGDILFFNFQGDATLSDLTITGGTQSGSRAETAIQFRADGGGLAQGPMGTVSLTDITVSGSYEKQPIGIFNYTDIGGSADGLQMTNVTVTADSTSYQTSINFDDIGGTIDFSDTAKFNNVNVSTAPDAVSLQGTSGVNEIIGKAEAEFIHAKGGDDVVRGNGGDDIIMADGRDGSDDAGTVDTAEFSGNYADYTLTWESLDIGFGAVEGVRLVGPDGSDFVGTVEILAFDGDTAKVLIVGSGGFATIQDAVDAAQAGDTILIAAGTWTGAGNDDVTIDKPLSIIGTGDGSTAADTIIDGGGFTLDMAVDQAGGTLLIQNLAIINAVGSGISSQDVEVLGTLTLDQVRIEDSAGNGVYVTGRQESSAYHQAGVQNVVITNSSFIDNAQSNTNAANIMLFEFDGNATITNVQASADAAAGAAYGIQINGVDGPFYAQLTPNGGSALGSYDVLTPMGTVTIDGLDVTGFTDKASFYIQGYTNMAGLTVTNSSVDTVSGWGKPVIIDPMADQLPSGTPNTAGNGGSFFDETGANGSYDLSGLTVTQHSTQFSELDGTTKADTIFGTNANDQITGFAGADTLKGDGETLSILGGSGLALTPTFGADTISGGDDADLIVGDVQQMDVTWVVGNSNVTTHFGNDHLNGGDGGDTVYGDVFNYQDFDNSTSNTSAIFGDDIIDGGANGDYLFGDGNAAQVYANLNSMSHAGAQAITGGNDVINGGEGADTIIGDFQSVTVQGDAGSITGGNDIIHGGIGTDTIYGDFVVEELPVSTNGSFGTITGGNDTIYGDAGDDTIHAGGGDDTIIWNVGDGKDVVDGGTETVADTMVVYGDATAETYDIYSDAFLIANAGIAATLGYTVGNAEIIIARNGTLISELSDIEEIVINGNGAPGVTTDAFNLHGDFTGTSLAYSTISIAGGSSDDVVDISELSSAHRIVFTANGGDDIILGTLRAQDVIELRAGTSVDDYVLTDNTNGTFTLSDGVNSVTYDGGGVAPTFTDDQGGSITDIPALIAGTAVTDEVSEADVIPAISTRTFASEAIDLSIPGSGSGGSGSDPVVSTIEVPVGGSIADLNVTLDLSHSWLGDLEVSLIAPDGTRISLLSEDGWYSVAGEMTFDDEAASDVYSGEDTGWVGTWRPTADSLADFDGKDMAGTWMLEIKDGYELDTGTLRSWSLEIEPVGGVPPLTTSEVEVDLASLVNVGAEVTPNGGAAFALKTIVTAEDLAGVTKGGVQVQVVSDGTTLTGFASGAPDTALFTLAVTDAGIATVTLMSGLDQTDDISLLDLSRFIEASDASGDSVALADGQFVITVTDNVPVVVAETFSGDEDTEISGSVGANDTVGADGAAVAGGYAVVTGPLHGALAGFNAVTGAFTYNPTADYNGADSFTYTVTDRDGDVSDPVTVALTVNPVNDAPVIEEYTSGQGYVEVAGDSSAQDIAAITGFIRVSDVDVGDTLTVEIVGVPTISWSGGVLPTAQAEALAQALAEGTLTVDSSLQSTGGDVMFEWTYDPTAVDLDFLSYAESLSVSLAMRVSDGSLTSQTVNFVATIAGSNDAPVVSSPVTLDAIAEDSGPRIITQAELMANASDLDINNETAATDLTITTGNGTLDDNGDGSWTYTPTDNDDTSVSFSYDVKEFYTTVPTSATLDITPVNDVPVIGGVDSGDVKEDDGINGYLVSSGKLTISDPDSGESSFQADTFTSASGAAWTIDTAGNWTYSLDNRDAPRLATLNDGQSFVDTINVTSADGTTKELAVTVNGNNESTVLDFHEYFGSTTPAPFSSYGGLTWASSASPNPNITASSAGYYGRTLNYGEGRIITLTAPTNGSFDFLNAFVKNGGGPGHVASSLHFEGFKNNGSIGSFDVALPGSAAAYAATYLAGRFLEIDELQITVTGESNGAGFWYMDNVTIRPHFTHDPIVLDLNGDGVDLSAAVAFDINADGTQDHINWAGPADGVLALDVDGSGAIENGAEVFSDVFNGSSYANSLAALATLDSNGDGVIDAQDAAYGDILIWQDANSDGVSQADELQTLAERGIESIDLSAAAVNQAADGNTIFAEGSYTKTDGSTGTYVGVALGSASKAGEDQTQQAAAIAAGLAIVLYAASAEEVAAGLETIVLTGEPQHGEIVITDDFTVIYTPTPGFEGADLVALETQFAGGTVSSRSIELAVHANAGEYAPPTSAGNGVASDGADGVAALAVVTGQVITADDGSNVLAGSAGDDLLSGVGGNDFLSGGAGDDILYGGDGDDVLIGGTGFDTLTGGAGADSFVLDSLDIADLITDYSGVGSDGDTIDLTALFDSSEADISGHVRYNAETGILSVSETGSTAGSPAVFHDAAQLGGDHHPNAITIIFDDGASNYQIELAASI